MIRKVHLKAGHAVMGKRPYDKLTYTSLWSDSLRLGEKPTSSKPMLFMLDRLCQNTLWGFLNFLLRCLVLLKRQVMRPLVWSGKTIPLGDVCWSAKQRHNRAAPQHVQLYSMVQHHLLWCQWWWQGHCQLQQWYFCSLPYWIHCPVTPPRFSYTEVWNELWSKEATTVYL